MKALTERLVAQALAVLHDADPASQQGRPTLAHDLIRSPQEYGELFALATGRSTTTTTTESTAEGGLVA